MTCFDRALVIAARTFMADDPDMQSEIISTTMAATSNASTARRLRELGSIAGLALTLRGRQVTADDRSLLLRHGASMGSTLVSLSTAAWMLSTTGPDVGVAVAAMALGFSTAVTKQGWRLALLIVAVVAWVVLGAGAVTDQAVLAGLALAVGLHLVGVKGHVGPRRRAAFLIGSASIIGLHFGVAALFGLNLITVPVIMAVCGLAPLVLLVIGWFDPRFAIAATAVWFWRLAATDLVDFFAALTRLGQDLDLDMILLRWMVMGSGVIIGVVVSRFSLRRHVAL